MPVHTKSPVASESNAHDESRWSFINEWHVNAQEDDRPPMTSVVSDGAGRPSARRAFARQSHQLKYKKWSQARHD